MSRKVVENNRAKVLWSVAAKSDRHSAGFQGAEDQSCDRCASPSRQQQVPGTEKTTGADV